VNRSRREIRALQSQETTPAATCFPGAQQIARLRRRVRRQGRSSTETVYLISSHPVSALPARELERLKRTYWTIESALHYRLDEVLDEDRSRVRTPRAAQILGRFRRLTVSFALPWLAQRRRTHERASTRDFHDHLRAANARRANLLVTASAPTSWRP
jgi:predicted transposase YbfD/YdcC